MEHGMKPTPKTVLSPEDRELAASLGGLLACNPFLPERIDWERRVLGDAFVPSGDVWSAPPAGPGAQANVTRIQALAEDLMRRILSRCLEPGAACSAEEAEVIEGIGNYVLYYRYEPSLHALVCAGEEAPEKAVTAPFFAAFARDNGELARASRGPGRRRADDAGHLLACAFQLRRAFHYIHRHILGQSVVTARLRAAVWQSVFSRDLRRYRRQLFDRLGDIPVLVTGPSGTGKELVSRAIAYSRYLPFDPKRGEFVGSWRQGFHPLNLAALSPTLVESELFGHRKGAFTGALEDHVGWFESCGRHGSVFLDELAEASLDTQVKLLRVLEERTFSRLGETGLRRFEGKLIAATNQDLGAAIAAGRFRADLYYRLCADTIRTPSLRERVASAPEELETLVQHIAERVAGPGEGLPLAAEVLDWVHRRLGRDYAWPGNVRELEQCVRSVLLRGEYHPPAGTRAQGFWERAAASELSADELLNGYCRQVYQACGSYEEAGRRLGLDRRTVRARCARAD